MAKPRRVLVTLESRATFGYSVNVIKRAMADPALEVQTLLTGMHLMPELGNSQSMLHRAQIPISATVPLTPGAGRAGWPVAMGHAISGFAEAYDKLDPEVVLISGDRAETFALAVAAVYMGLPVAHIQAGDKSGHIDDAARMALAKLVHIHLAPGADAVERLNGSASRNSASSIPAPRSSTTWSGARSSRTASRSTARTSTSPSPMSS